MVSPTTVYCQTSTPHVVVEGDVWLLSADTGERLFLLPLSYYAKIVNLDESYYYITFNGVVGKVNKSLVSTVGYHTTAIGTAKDIGISEEFSEFNAIALKEFPMLSARGICDVPTSATFTYIGSYPTENGTWYYVRFDSSYGYIRSDRTTEKSITPPAFLPESPPEEEVTAKEQTSEEVQEDSKSKALRIIIIVGLCIPAVLIVILLFKPSPLAKRHEDAEAK